MDLSGMRAWPVMLGGSKEEDTPSTLEYHEPNLAGLTERCATAAADWGTDKTASKQEPTLLYKDPDAHPLVLMMMVLDRYGDDSTEWDPEVLRVTMMRDNLQVSGSAWTKLMAARVLLVSPSPWRQWHVFHWIARSLAGLPPNFVYLEQPELGHLMAASDIMRVVDPTRPFNTAVDKFVAAALKHEGHVFAPEPLAFAQRELEDPQLECFNCGAKFQNNTDVKCVSCGHELLHVVPYVFRDLRDECAALWKTRQSLPLEPSLEGLPEGPAGHLVRDLLIHGDYARHIRRNLLAQLRVLSSK